MRSYRIQNRVQCERTLTLKLQSKRYTLSLSVQRKPVKRVKTKQDTKYTMCIYM